MLRSIPMLLLILMPVRIAAELPRRVGLRLGIARLNAALIRIDWAYAFNSSPHSRRGPVWSISTTQAF